MQKLRVKITGSKVHDVGYRVLLVNKALSLGVDRFNTFNTYIDGIQAVIAVIEADDEAIEDFKNFVTAFIPEKATVKNISFEEYKNTVPPIERAMQAFQMEQWGKGIPILVQMLEKQDTTIHILERVHEDTSDIKSTLTRIEVDVKDTKLSLSSFIDEKFKKVEGEIAEIKATLARIQEAE